MKKKIIIVLIVAVLVFILYKKRETVIATVVDPDVNHAQLYKDMVAICERIYTGDESEYLDAAKSWCASMIRWCAEKANGWSFASENAKAILYQRTLPEQMVTSIAWQLYGTQNLYSDDVWHKLEDRLRQISYNS